ncbi:hypothetical protein MMS39_30720, partial [Escherichia coli]|nr:hypothetical protein [Escherichia coli]
IVSVVTLVWGISPRQPSGKNIIRWLLKKRTNGSVRYCQYTSIRLHIVCDVPDELIDFTFEWKGLKKLCVAVSFRSIIAEQKKE